MALGEFDLGDLLEGDEDFVVSIAQKFRMALVALLAILGSARPCARRAH